MVSGIHNDNVLARLNMRRLYGSLLEAGVEIYEYDRTMLHQKYMVCDGVWSTVGSTNLDWRSLLYNDEINVVVLGGDFAEQLNRVFANDLANSDQITPAAWHGRALPEGSTTMSRRAQPPMQGLGNVA